MTKQEIVRELQSKYGAFVNVNEVAEYMRSNRWTVRQYLYGLPHLEGRSKLYKVQDIAQMIMERSTI